MENIYKKSLLAFSLVFSLGLSAMEDKTGTPIQQDSNAKIAASVAANILAIGAMTVANAYIAKYAYPDKWYKQPQNVQYTRQLMLLASRIGLVELSNYLINKSGLKTNKFYLYAGTFGSTIPSMIQSDIKNF